jgi:hypothetical protein
VKSRRVQVLAATVGLWAAHAVPGFAGQEPARIPTDPGQNSAVAADPAAANQQMASAIASQLKNSGRLHQYSINVNVNGSAVELSGQVADAAQREDAVRMVQAMPGVQSVRDALQIIAPGVVTASAATQPAIGEPRPLPQKSAEIFQAPVPQNAGTEPMPVFRAAPSPGAPGMGLNSAPPPPMPPYAWPTYAPYNNYSRVATPTLYPNQAFPFIGPMYPYPKVPLGWRSVNLTWQDGHWWYGRTACGHDWWRVRFW